MANMLFANNCNTTLSSSLTNVATSMSVTSATGFPAPTGSQYFYCTLADAATQTTIEIVKVTAVSGTTFTIVRGQDGTTGTIFASGAVVSLRLVRANLNDFPKLDEVNTFSQTQTFSAAPIASTLTGFVYGNGASAQTVATNAQLLTLLGTLPVGNGGTGLTTLTAGYIPYGNGTSAFSSSSTLTYNGSTLYAPNLQGPAINYYLGTNQSISAATFTRVNLNTAMFDTNSNFDTSLHRFTPLVAGYYQVNAQVSFSTAGTLNICSLYKNGSRGFAEAYLWTTGGASIIVCSGLIYMNGSTDFLELWAYCDSTANTVVSGKNNTAFSASLVRSA